MALARAIASRDGRPLDGPYEGEGEQLIGSLLQEFSELRLIRERRRFRSMGIHPETRAATIRNALSITFPAEFPSSVFARWYRMDGYGSWDTPLWAMTTNYEFTHESLVGVCEACPEALAIPGRMTRELPLHHACSAYLPIKSIRYLYEKYPDAIKAKSRFGTVLHHACACPVYRDMPRKLEIIRYLLDVCPELATMKTDNGMYPLQTLFEDSTVAVKYAEYQEAILALLASAPEAAAIHTKDDILPIMFVIRKSNLCAGELGGRVVTELLEAYPEAANNAELVIHAFKYDRPWDVRVTVLSRYLARSKCPSLLKYTERYPLHSIVKCPLLARYVLKSIRNFSDHLSQADDDGKLPIHIALYQDSIAMRDLVEMLEIEPRAALFRDPSSGMYPFLIICTCGIKWKFNIQFVLIEHRVDLVYRALRVEPSKFLEGALKQSGE